MLNSQLEKKIKRLIDKIDKLEKDNARLFKLLKNLLDFLETS